MTQQSDIVQTGVASLKADRRLWWRRVRRAVEGLLLLWGIAIVHPAVLAFPYKAQFGDTTVYAQEPIPAAMAASLGRSDALIKASPIFSKNYGRTLYFTDGGWRWKLLALRSSSALAISRPLRETIVFAQTDMAKQLVRDMPLDKIIAHERTHGLIRGHLGLSREFMTPRWKVEGYCDHVAQRQLFTEAEAEKLRRTDPDSVRLFYYDAKRRVDAALAANGSDVDGLFAAATK